MFCAICTEDKGPFRSEEMDGKLIVVCLKCQTAPANLYTYAASSDSAVGQQGVGHGNRRSFTRGGGA